MNGNLPSVLVVASDGVERDRISAALEGHGFQVLLCSGPAAPDYTCLGTRKGRCPLATDECVVVLDMDLPTDAGSGTSAEELLDFYLEARHPVLALTARPTGFEGDRLLERRRHPETDVLLECVWRLASA
jgi:CheY-like chemotaxis protein